MCLMTVRCWSVRPLWWWGWGWCHDYKILSDDELLIRGGQTITLTCPTSPELTLCELSPTLLSYEVSKTGSCCINVSDASFLNPNLHKSQVSGLKRLHRRNCECFQLYRSTRKLCLNDLCKHCLCHTVKSPTFALHQSSWRHLQSITRDPYKIRSSRSVLTTATESQVGDLGCNLRRHNR